MENIINHVETELENIIDKMELEFKALANQHRGIASNEHTWALGSFGETSAMHEQNAEEHHAIAEIYDNLSEHVLTIIEQYLDN